MIKLEKMDVARRQYRAALELWFADGDPVAIHTLAMAANEVLTDVAEHRGLNHLSSDFITDVISKALSSTPEEAHRLRTSSANFFKHADRDPDDELEFDPEWNVPILAWSLVCLLHMHESFALVERAFWMRLAVEQPNRY